MRQNNIINYVLCLSLILTLFGKDLKGQTYSEAPMVYWEDSVLTDMIYVKFKKHNVVELPQGQTKATGHAISPSYPEIRQVFSDYSSKRGIFLTELQLRKAVPEAQPADTLFIDPKSGQGRILPDLSRIYLILFPKPVNVDPLMAKLEKRPEVEYTHGPVQWVEMAVETPDDPFYVDGTQWYLDAIQAPLAWEITKGSSTIRIALIEASGVELDHEDLMVKIAGGDNNPSGILSAHGTAVAGFAGAATNNGIGVASLGWKITLLTYQPVPDDDERTVLAGKINDAVNAGARVINMSFRTVKNDENLEACPDPLPPGFNKGQINWDYPAVRDAVAAAIGSNVVVIAAAGNDASSGNVFIYPCYEVPFTVWPANYPGVIGVSGSEQSGDFVDGWNYNPPGVDLIDVNAPGRTDANEGLITTGLNDGYYKDAGTSFSAPQVAALAALIKSFDPGMPPSQVEQILENNADKIGQYPYTNGHNDYFGHGRINALQAVLEAENGVWYNAYQNKSLQSNATYSNSARHLLRGAGYLHEVFTSGGDIFYRRSGDDGPASPSGRQNWQVTPRENAIYDSSGRIHKT